jgi:hypothetical protein
MPIQLTPDQEQRIQAIVNAGAYPSAEEALDAAVAAVEVAATPGFEGSQEQSYVSDELTHFVGKAIKLPDGSPNNPERYALFLKILCDSVPRTPREGWLKASYREKLGPGITMRSDGQKQLSKNEAVMSTMLCFCDIPLGQLQIHMQKYGSFGIAFCKHFLLRRGATPVYYIPRNARSNLTVGRGPRTVAEQFDVLRADFQRFSLDLEEYVTRIDGPTSLLAKLPGPNTPAGHRLRGLFSALERDLDELMFARMKFFEAGLPEGDDENFYMEREWRLHGDGLRFRLGDIARIFLPQEYCQQFHEDIPEYTGPVCSVSSELSPDSTSFMFGCPSVVR